jgi:preprotein translocase subunit YajC
MSVSSKLLASAISAVIIATAAAADPASAQERMRDAGAPVQGQAMQVQAEQVVSKPVGSGRAEQAQAQDQVIPPPEKTELAQGAQVRDTNGAEVGTITSVDGQFVILKTDRHEVRLPVASFAAAPGHFLIALTRDQLNAEVDKTKAQASANLAAGAIVTGSQGATVGTIEAIDAEFVTLKLTSGKMVRLPRNAIAGNATGGAIGMTAAELQAAAAAAGAGS